MNFRQAEARELQRRIMARPRLVDPRMETLRGGDRPQPLIRAGLRIAGLLGAALAIMARHWLYGSRCVAHRAGSPGSAGWICGARINVTSDRAAHAAPRQMASAGSTSSFWPGRRGLAAFQGRVTTDHAFCAGFRGGMTLCVNGRLDGPPTRRARSPMPSSTAKPLALFP
jgi:hypothetical protein